MIKQTSVGNILQRGNLLSGNNTESIDERRRGETDGITIKGTNEETNLRSMLIQHKELVNGGSPKNHIESLPNPIEYNSRNGTVSSTIQCSSDIESDISMMDQLDQSFQQQLIQLKQEQELQHQLLLQRYQTQRDQLAQAHEKQLHQRLKEFWDNKRRQDEEKERIEAIKRKEKHEESAIASSEVKQKLQGFLLSKKQRESNTVVNTNSSGIGSPSNTAVSSSPPFPTGGVWNHGLDSVEQQQHPTPHYPHPHQTGRRHPFIGKCESEDFPLRKTASEPNLLKMRLKQRVLDRRSSPLVKRREKGSHLKRRSYLATEGSGSAGSTPDSGPNSPPINGVIISSRSGSGERTPQHEDGSNASGGGTGGNGSSSPFRNQVYGSGTNSASVSDLTLYSSPSLPNISLGKPLALDGGSKLESVSESEARSPILPAPASSGPFPTYPPPHTGVIMDPGGGNTHPIHPIDSMYHHQSPSNVLALYQAAAASAAAAVSQQDMNEGNRKDPRRPLGRTQSAPLPLGHPMLLLNAAAAAAAVAASGASCTPSSTSLINGIVSGGSVSSGSSSRGNQQVLDPQQVHQLLRQHIRQTVLTRAGSRGTTLNSNSLNRTISVEEDTSGDSIDVVGCGKSISPSLTQPQDLTTSQNIPQLGSIRTHSSHYHHYGPRPLSRTLSSPLVALGSLPSHTNEQITSLNHKVHGHGPLSTGLAYDSLMLKHQCLCGDNTHHPEHPGRLQSIWARLQETGLVNMCERIRTRKATLEEIQSCHTEAHTLLFGTNPLSRQRMELSKFPESSLPIKSLVRLPCNGIGVDSDTAWNELHTPSAARIAVGCVLDLAFRVAMGDLRNGFAICRPPGHHAEPMQAMGFCFFNNVAIAAKQLRSQLQLEKILIVDWDVHHGNGAQQIFYDDPHVLYLSIHRHDDGNFFPGTGGPMECGTEDGMGFNVNIGWGGSLNPPMGDAEYLAAFRSVVLPIALDFQPEIVLVSCGFDAAKGHPPPLGGYNLSPACFGWMTQQLMNLAGGKVVLVLEGGYDLPAICDSAQECVKALLGENTSGIAEEELLRAPCAPAIETLLRTQAIQSPHWPCVKRYANLINCSAIGASSSFKVSCKKERDECETISAMASLSMRYGGSDGNVSTRTTKATIQRLSSTAEGIDEEENTTEIILRNATRRSESIEEEAEEPMDQDDVGK